MKFLLTMLIVLAPLRAADGPEAVVLWTAAKFKGLEKSLVPKMDETKGGAETLITKSSHNALVFHREGSGLAEIHEKLADFMVFRNGEGTIMVGGKMIEGKPTGAGEIRGKKLEGAKPYKVSAGDVLYVPANVPHQTIVEAGKTLDCLVIKMNP